MRRSPATRFQLAGHPQGGVLANESSSAPIPGGLVLLLGAAAQLSAEATRLFLAELSLTENSVRVLKVLSAPGMPAARAASLTHLSLDEASFALASLHLAGYARPRRPGRWSRTASGTAVVEELARVRQQCDARAGETELRAGLHKLIQSMSTDSPEPA